MRYISTRGECPPISFREAVATGLAPDGGLYLPENIPDLGNEMCNWAGLDYRTLCYEFFRHFTTDMPDEQLKKIVYASHQRFDPNHTAPLIELDDNTFVLELFHGPTLAFKDFALQLLGNLYEAQIKASGQPINVLGATSGDTGSAAIHGLLGKKGVKIFILYPSGRISELQERQMTTTGAGNVFPIAIEGSFDDAQRAIKALFGDLDFKARYRLSAVNSINLARILAQCVYYIWAWLRLPEERRQNVEFVVPTGNFGNVLAGWMARKMGLPIQSFRVATNQNDILYRLFTEGVYEVDTVQPSLAPSMDIQVASNFERFLYYKVGQEPAQVRSIMEQMRATGKVAFNDFQDANFSASRSTDKDIQDAIQHVYKHYDYIVDPHTACGFQQLNRNRTSVVLATASPAKFPDVIERAIGVHPRAEALERLKSQAIVSYPLPAETAAIRAFIEEHAEAAH